MLLLAVSGVFLVVALLDVASAVWGIASGARDVHILWIYSDLARPPYLAFCLLTALGRVRRDRITSWGVIAHLLIVPALLAGTLHLVVPAGLWLAVACSPLLPKSANAAQPPVATAPSNLIDIVGVGLAWGIGVGFLTMVLAYLSPLVLGQWRYMQHPIHAMGFGLAGGCLAFFVALVLQVPRVLKLSTGEQVIHIVLLVALALVPVRVAVRSFIGLTAEAWRLVETSREDRMRHAAPLTDAERALRENRYFDLTVAVEPSHDGRMEGHFVVQDLEATGLFRRVWYASETESPDLIATVTGQYFRPETGVSFDLALATGTTRIVSVDVHYERGRQSMATADRETYLDRLAVETIRAIEPLIELTNQ